MNDDKCIVDPERDCIGKAEAAKLEGRIRNLEDWRDDSKSFQQKFYEWERKQIDRDARLDEKLSAMDTNIKKLVMRDEAQNDSHKKRVDAIIDKVIWAVLAAVIAFLLARIGL